MLNDTQLSAFETHQDVTGICWEWTGAHDRDGYGRTTIDGKHYRTHRLSWEVYRSQIPDGFHVLHLCNNAGCLRPDHLYLGTHADNTADKAKDLRPVHITQHV